MDRVEILIKGDMNLIATDIVWVNSNQQLQGVYHQCKSLTALAIDTEFMRSETFYPVAGLLQLSDGKQCFLIDPLSIDDWSPLILLLQDPSITKILHACSEDLEVFQSLLGVVPSPVFDTQIAAAIAGYGYSLGYARLLEALLHVAIPKNETRSDWLQRPLSEAQLHYAAMDVAYLPAVYEKLTIELESKNRLVWLEEDCRELEISAARGEDMTQAYRKIKLAWQLSQSSLAVLQVLCLWREQQARKRNVPRNRLLKESVLLELARKKPYHLAALTGIKGLSPRVIKSDGEQLVGLVVNILAASKALWPETLPAPLPSHYRDLIKVMKSTVRSCAEKLDIAPEILVKKKEYESLARSGLPSGRSFELPDQLLQWRKAVIGDHLLNVAKDYFKSQ